MLQSPRPSPQHVFHHLHHQPQDSHGVDFSRVRLWALNGWGQYYRQSLVFSSFPTPEINAVFKKYCLNILSCSLLHSAPHLFLSSCFLNSSGHTMQAR